MRLARHDRRSSFVPSLKTRKTGCPPLFGGSPYTAPRELLERAEPISVVAEYLTRLNVDAERAVL